LRRSRASTSRGRSTSMRHAAHSNASFVAGYSGRWNAHGVPGEAHEQLGGPASDEVGLVTAWHLFLDAKL
jgi:hypothetical protein